MTKFLFKLEQRAWKRGLSKKKQLKERRLRKHVMKARHDIRIHGTIHEKKMGLSLIPQGTVSWYLVYNIRSQNEGINGIIKKRHVLIGDGQPTPWTIGLNKIRKRIQTQIVFIKIGVLLHFWITGQTKNGMSRTYNWVIKTNIFIFVWIYSGNPHIISEDLKLLHQVDAPAKTVYSWLNYFIL